MVSTSSDDRAADRPEPALMLAPGAPEGALPGCPGDLVVSVEHWAGGWSSLCEITLSVDCDAPGCWWGRVVTNSYDVPLRVLSLAKQVHDMQAREAS